MAINLADHPYATITISQDDLWDLADCAWETGQTNLAMGDTDTAIRLMALAIRLNDDANNARSL